MKEKYNIAMISFKLLAKVGLFHGTCIQILSIVHLYPFDHVIMLTLIPEYTFVEWETEIPSISFIRTKFNEDDTSVFAQ